MKYIVWILAMYFATAFSLAVAGESRSSESIKDLTGVRAISGAGSKACALLQNEIVRCWSLTQTGIQFDDTTRNGVKAITLQDNNAGELFCSLLDSGEARCEGSYFSEPVDFKSESNIKVVNVLASPSTEFACALFDDGRIQCVGNNGQGQLGNGTKVDRSEPIFVSGIHDAKTITLGWDSACAILKNERVKCWGKKFSGERQSEYLVPIYISGLRDAERVVVGDGYACGLLKDRNVRCWGANYLGELGNFDNKEGKSPTKVSNLSNAVDILSLGSSTCVVLADGGVKCWGSGFGDAVSNASYAVEYGGDGHAIKLVRSYGGETLCEMEKDGTVRCGTASAGERTYPIPTLTSVVELVGDGDLMCALLENGRVRCWTWTQDSDNRVNLKHGKIKFIDEAHE